MTAKGKINVAEIARRAKGTVWVLITDDPAGRKPASADAGPDSRWTLAFLKTGMTAALVTDVAPVGGNRRIRYNLITDKGTVHNLPGQQTLLLAPTPPPAEPEPAADLPADEAPFEVSPQFVSDWRSAKPDTTSAL